MKIYTKAEFTELLHEQKYLEPDEVVRVVNRWLARHDGAAIYQNVDFGHPEVGHVKLISFGSPAAQLEVVSSMHLPEQLPDGLPAGAINWRYSLQGIYRGEPVAVDEVS
jgi:hypothetical protein